MKYFFRTLFLIILLPVSQISNSGSFEGEIVTKWINDRDMEILNEISYLDNNGLRWDVPSHSVVDGASIPRVLWTVIGPPFVGFYRNASVFHDFYCDSKERPWNEVHRMFYEAMLDLGVETIKAKSMYAAVYSFGPRWEEIRTAQGVDFLEWDNQVQDQDYQSIVDWIEKNDPPLGVIDQKVNSVSIE